RCRSAITARSSWPGSRIPATWSTRPPSSSASGSGPSRRRRRLPCLLSLLDRLNLRKEVLRLAEVRVLAEGLLGPELGLRGIAQMKGNARLREERLPAPERPRIIHERDVAQDLERRIEPLVLRGEVGELGGGGAVLAVDLERVAEPAELPIDVADGGGQLPHVPEERAELRRAELARLGHQRLEGAERRVGVA